MGVYSIVAVHVHAFSLLQIKGNMAMYLSHSNLHLLRAGSSYWSSADVWWLDYEAEPEATVGYQVHA